MPQITKTRQIADGCYAIVLMTCPPELRGWDRHLFTFFKQVANIHFSTTDPALHFTDGSLRGNIVRKKLDGATCLFEFYLVKSYSSSTSVESLRKGIDGHTVLYPVQEPDHATHRKPAT